MDRRKLTLVYNADAGDGGWTAERLTGALVAEGFEIVAAYSAGDADISAILAGLRGVVVVAGGDGTVGKVAMALADPDATLAIVPTGGANNIARALGVPERPEDAIAGLKRGRAGALRIGKLHGTAGERRFVESIGLGPSARAAQNPKDGAPPDKKRAQVRKVIRGALRKAEPIQATVVIDGVPFRDPALMIEVMNITLVGPNLEIAPHADPGDAELVVAWLPVSARAEMIGWLAAPDEARPPLLWRRGRRVEIRLAGDALRIDDDVVDLVGGTVVAELRGEPVAVLVPGGPDRDG